jgi:hypothetical protein
LTKVDATKKSDCLCREAEIRQLAEKDACGEKETGQTTTGTIADSMVFVSISAGARVSRQAFLVVPDQRLLFLED